MLVLARKTQESIHIGDEITISVLRIKGNTVRLGIEAPGNVRIVRSEIVADRPSESGPERFDTEVPRGARQPHQKGDKQQGKLPPPQELTPQASLGTTRVNRILARRRREKASQEAGRPPILVAS
jgi:carbon storage regulator CsrA